MASYDIKQLHERLLRILVMFDKVCRDYGLRYCINGGTLLGAVRHKGFIPWDDDLDVAMPRPDYEKLIAHCREWLPKPYEFVCAENDPDYPLPFGKIQDASTTLIERRHLYYLGGCYIDIFPWDAYPSSWLLRKRQRLEYFYLKKCLYLVHRDPYRHGRGPASWLPRLVRRLYTMRNLQRRIRKVCTRYDWDTAKIGCSYTDGWHRILPTSITGVYAPYEFEGHTVMGVKDYDTYLRAMYNGDYMQLPPENERIQHNFDLLDLSTPYREYKAD